MPMSQPDKAVRFRALHQEPHAFVIPNPWDAGSARVLEALGFKAVASTSSGFAFTRGRLDGDVTLDQVVQHAEELDRAIGLPVSIDLEHGYGRVWIFLGERRKPVFAAWHIDRNEFNFACKPFLGEGNPDPHGIRKTFVVVDFEHF